MLLAYSILLSPCTATEADDEAFRLQVRPIIRSYIFSNYDRFRDSELTFRDLKEHVAEVLHMTYEELKEDEKSCASRGSASTTHFATLFFCCMRWRASLTHILLARSVGRLAIEDETDFVTNTCNGGGVPFATCKRRVEEHKGGYDSATDSVPYDSQQHNEPKAEL